MITKNEMETLLDLIDEYGITSFQRGRGFEVETLQMSGHLTNMLDSYMPKEKLDKQRREMSKSKQEVIDYIRSLVEE